MLSGPADCAWGQLAAARSPCKAQQHERAVATSNVAAVEEGASQGAHASRGRTCLRALQDQCRTSVYPFPVLERVRSSDKPVHLARLTLHQRSRQAPCPPPLLSGRGACGQAGRGWLLGREPTHVRLPADSLPIKGAGAQLRRRLGGWPPVGRARPWQRQTGAGDDGVGSVPPTGWRETPSVRRPACYRGPGRRSPETHTAVDETVFVCDLARC